MGDKIFWIGTEDALEEIHGAAVLLLLQEGLTQEAIGGDMARMLVENMPAVRHGFREAAFLNQFFDPFMVGVYGNLAHVALRHHTPGQLPVFSCRLG